jgi:tetratricopeptide (TPR) repeat protein
MLFAESKKMPEIMGYHAGHSRISLGSFSVTELRVMVTYVRLAFLPFNQNFSYDYPVFKSVFEFPVLISAVFLMTVLYFAKRLFVKYRLVSFSIFWFFLTLLPESSFLPLEDVIFEHRLYLPLVGYSMFLVSSLYYLFGKKTFRMTGTVLAMLIICYSVLTYQRNNVWKDEFTLWDDTVKKSPHKAVGYINRGMAYSKRALLIRAMADFNQAIEIDPNITEAYNDRGYVYICFGDYIEAISDLNRALELNSNFAFAYYNRGVAYYHLGKYDKAWADVHKAKALGAVVNLKFINDLKKASF